ncbi:double-stranded RNA-binding domain (DsRBD)-containing protein [Trifolium repens]|nr:double-stranded RNA-binding domain (DsRBD)-containing protein [Trifolium repens]
METKEHCVVAPKKPTLTPKAIIHQKFGKNACYVVEEVKEVCQTGCPGLSIPQTGPCLYRCTLQLPELTVVSETFKKKKDAEQSAAEMAIEKLGIIPETTDLTPQEAQESLVARIAYLFSEKFLMSDHPLSGHIRATLRRKGDQCGSIPISVISVCDAKIFSLCKCINPEVESNPFLVLPYIVKATTMLHEFLAVSEQHIWIRKLNPYPQDIIESLMEEGGSQECIRVEAIRIPSSMEKHVEAVTLCMSLREYYLDIIANELGLEDDANVLISRNIGKASSETRLFFAAPQSYLLDQSCISGNGKETVHFEGSLNVRARYLSGQDIVGDAILACIGYTRKSRDLFYEDVTVRLYFRMLLGKTPGGIYKLSREALLTAELPSRFTTRVNWRGSLPRDILCMFCRQHHLSEPLFSIISHPLKIPTESSESCFKAADSGTDVIECANGASVNGSPKLSDSEMLKCEIKLLSKCGDVILLCSPKDCYKKQNDAIQNASLKLLSWLNKYFNSATAPFDQLYETAGNFSIHISSKNLFRDIFAAGDSAKMSSLLSSKACCVEYEISLTKVAEPPEERMEQALFSPPLSKQRVEFAVQHILESHATNLLDFGCGSGSLLEALLNYTTSLEKIAGVDISQKGLTRAAKVLNSKLDAGVTSKHIKSLILYEGSITNFDSRLHGFDIGTCLEVIEHMEEDQACLFGDVALSYFCPRILIVSTPNFEYNVVLQKSSPPAQDQEESDDQTLLQSCKFRNNDHKFEWTREQFTRWASELAARHNYNVEFSGVGGSTDVEPGFASQIAVFKREWSHEDDVQKGTDIDNHYNVIWEWNNKNN